MTGGGQATIFGHQFDSQLVAGDYVEAFAFNGDSTVRNVDGGLSETFLGIRWVSRTV